MHYGLDATLEQLGRSAYFFIAQRSWGANVQATVVESRAVARYGSLASRSRPKVCVPTSLYVRSRGASILQVEGRFARAGRAFCRLRVASLAQGEHSAG